MNLDLSNRHANHTIRLVRDLTHATWVPTIVPSDARLLSNRQLIELVAPQRTLRVRVSIYKVGNRGEPHRLDERRIEITTTFASGLIELPDWTDVVLGYDFETDSYVGLDARRLSLGGSTHNASSSVDPAALQRSTASRIIIRPHETPSLGLEYQAFFLPSRLSEYLFNAPAIHSGYYLGNGLFSGRTYTCSQSTWTIPSSSCLSNKLILTYMHQTTSPPTPIAQSMVEAFEIADTNQFNGLSPDEFELIRLKSRNVGDRGEHYVYRYERRRLQRLGRADLANKVDWISRRDIGKGYDIKSYELDGSPRHIEVKSTIGSGRSFFITSNEWTCATRMRSSYWIYRVVNALDRPQINTFIQDPVDKQRLGILSTLPHGLVVTITGKT